MLVEFEQLVECHLRHPLRRGPDIVVRLRSRADAEDGASAVLLLEAANAIERLRNEVDAVLSRG